METSQLLLICLAIWAIAYGASVFIPERTIVVISAIAAIITGVVALAQVL